MRHAPTQLPILALVAGLSIGAAASSLLAGPAGDPTYRAGISLLNKGLHDLAEAELRTYLKVNPEGAHATHARYALAVCLVRLDRHVEAERELEPVLAARGFEFAADALFLAAQCAIRAKDDASAVGLIERLSREHADWERLDQANLAQGEALLRLGRLVESRDRLATVSARWPESPAAARAELFCAMAESSLGEFGAAADRAARQRSRWPKSELAAHAALLEAKCRSKLSQLTQAAALFGEAARIATGATRAEALLGAASMLRRMSNLQEAERLLSEAESGGDALPAELSDRLTMERGRLLLEGGKARDALERFSRLERSDREDVAVESAFWQARCESALGEFQAAALRLERAAARFPRSGWVPDMMFDRAAALARLGDQEAALEAWEQWRSAFGKHELACEACIAEAWCAHRLGMFDRSSTLCEQARRTCPQQAPSESLLLLHAENAFALGQFGSARTGYEALLTRYPTGSYAWRAGVRRGLCMAESGEGKAAAAVLEPLINDATGAEPVLRLSGIASLGELAAASEDWPAAEKWFELLAREAPDPRQVGQALLRQGLCVWRQQRAADAIELFDRLIREQSDSSAALQARFERAQCLIELDRLDEAAAELEEVLAREAEPSRFSGHAIRHLAAIASRRGDPEAAARWLSRIPESAQEGETLLQAGLSWLAAGRYAEAQSALERYMAARVSAPQNGEALVALATASNRLGRYTEALGRLENIDDAGWPTELRASAQYESAVALRGLGRATEATQALRAVLEQGPTRLEPYAALELAEAAVRTDDWEKALLLVQRARETAERLVDQSRGDIRERASYLGGLCLSRLGRHADAAEECARFVETYPGSALLASVLLLSGESLLELGNASAAASALDLASRTAGTDEVRKAAILRSGEAWAGCQRWSESAAACSVFLTNYPDSELWFRARFGLGWARENMEQHDAAIEAYRDVVARHDGPTAARAQFQIGECLYAQGKREQAVAELLRVDALYAYPEWSAAALFEAGRCLRELGRQADAENQFSDLKKRFPDSRWAGLAREQASESTTPPRLEERSAAEAKTSR